jgi:type III secretory pathway lipoprotein EscJ
MLLNSGQQLLQESVAKLKLENVKIVCVPKTNWDKIAYILSGLQYRKKLTEKLNVLTLTLENF